MKQSTICVFNIIVISIFTELVLSLKVEAIIDGELAEPSNNLFQAAVIARKNGSNTYYLIGGGAMIGRQFMLSAAQVFIDQSFNMKQLSFSISVGSVNLSSSACRKIEIDIIYMPKFPGGLYVNDIAVSKLKDELKINENWAIIGLYRDKKPYIGPATISGFGYHEVQTALSSDHVRYRSSGAIDGLLRIGVVDIKDDKKSLQYHPNIYREKQLCGFMRPVRSDKAGICTNDAGSVLVVRGHEDQIIAVAGRNYADCNDVKSGCVYTRITPFISYIDAILEDIPVISSYEIQNKPHSM